MKRKIRIFFRMPMLIVLMVILIFFTPLAIYSPGENRNRGVVTALGIDKNNNEYEISLLTFIPTANQSYQEKSSVISGKGSSVADAVYNAQIAMGRSIGLSHAKTTVVNEMLLEEDVASTIDYLSRVASLPENTVFICTNKTAKEMLESSQDLINNLGLKLEQIIGYNANNIYVTDTSLEAFYKGYFSPAKSSLIGYLTIEDEENKPQEISEIDSLQNSGTDQKQSSQGEANQGESQAGGSGNSSHIVNQGQAVLLKEGKKVALLDIDQLNGINLLNPKSVNQIIRVDVEKEGQQVSMSYKIKTKKTLVSTKFENNYPIYIAQLILGVKLVEINGQEGVLKVNTEFSEITEEIALKIEEQIKRQFTTSIKILRDCDTDVLGIGKEFFLQNRKQFRKYIEGLGGEESVDKFIDYVTFKLNVIVQPD